MSTEAGVLDPQIEELLKVVASDPRSTLLRVSRPQKIRGFIEGASRRGQIGLTAAERQLVACHRQELAFWLREECKSRLYANTNLKRRIILNYSATGRVEILPIQSIHNAAQDSANRAMNAGVAPGDVSLIDSCIVESREHAATAAECALASARLEPTDQARIYVALDLLTSNKSHQALRVLNTVMAAFPSRSNKAAALDNIALARAQLEDLELALSAAQESASLCADRTTPVMHWLFYASCLGRKESAAAAASRLDDLIPSSHPGVDEFLTNLQWQQERGEWNPSAYASRGPGIVSKGGSAAERIIDGLFKKVS
jgi:tetratricopeptide (TPR) repeat protein